MDNDYKISKNCLTYLNHSNNGGVRFKCCKKIVRSLESPSIGGFIGSHIRNCISDANTNVKKANKNSKGSGLLRL